MEINEETKLLDIVNKYPWLKSELVKINGKFKMLGSPMGKIMLKKATIADMSKKSGMAARDIISSVKMLIETHK